MTIAHAAWTYGLSVLVGVLPAWGFVTALSWRINRAIEAKPTLIWWGLPLILGLTERTVVTTLMLFTPGLTAGFTGGWVVLKLAGNWGALVKDRAPEHRGAYLVSLLGSVISIGWAAAVTAILNPEVLPRISN